MIVDINKKRGNTLLVNANIREVIFPDCCLNCSNYNIEESKCRKLDIDIESVFQICDFYDEDPIITEF